MSDNLKLIKSKFNPDRYQEFLYEFNEYLIEEGYYYEPILSMENELEGSKNNKKEYNKVKLINREELEKLVLVFLKTYVQNKYIEPFYMHKFIVNHHSFKNIIPVVRMNIDDIDDSLEDLEDLNSKSIKENHDIFEKEYIEKLEKLVTSLPNKHYT